MNSFSGQAIIVGLELSMFVNNVVPERPIPTINAMSGKKDCVAFEFIFSFKFFSVNLTIIRLFGYI